MRNVLLLMVAVGALAIVPGAAAKGPSTASVDGPGLQRPLEFGGGESAGTPVMQLVEAAGFFPGAFSRQPNPMAAKRPRGALGVKYAISYVVPTGDATPDRIKQYVYPYASPRPVTFMPAGQTIFGGKTTGGWYVSTASLKDRLVAAGLPRTAPRVQRRGTNIGAWIELAGILAAVAGAGLAWRRRSIGRCRTNRLISDTVEPNV